MTGETEKFWGQTKYAPVMEDVFKKYVVEEPSQMPTFIIFITDYRKFIIKLNPLFGQFGTFAVTQYMLSLPAKDLANTIYLRYSA